jgi:hypothetical protein
MEPEGSLPYSQQPAIAPSHEPDEFSPQPHILFKFRCILCSGLCLGIPVDPFPSCFACKFRMNFSSLPWNYCQITAVELLDCVPVGEPRSDARRHEFFTSLSQWPRCPWCARWWTARTLKSRVRILLGSCLFSFCVVSVSVLCGCPLRQHGASRVAVGGDGLLIWRVAVDILNTQSRTDDRG